ncbi:MAG: hypothetical protein EPO55_06260 [Reyranella sp.]|uniref:hypothetical protein n=1 Tax=Reyranella sp. TaxID=1929291 RepID=UPI00120DD458|nr:hypothetical protein [Reyranella sp.]TAJ41270.1 MAG: hypothetical protein EPO55_06260 [Reyranella sp.]
MTVTVVTRWTTPNVPASTKVATRSRALWKKLGALDVRLNQMFTGPQTGQWLFVVVFPDMAVYAKASAAATASADMQELLADNAKIGAVMHEREILVGLDF